MTEPTEEEIIALLGDRQFSSITAVREAFCDTAGNWKWAEYERNFGVHHRPCTVTHWKPNLPPTSAEGVEHGPQ